MPGGRPKGARSYATKNVRTLLDRLQREGRLQPERIFERLQEIALSPDAPDRIAAARLVLAYFYGQPTARLDVEHGLGPSAVELLLRIHGSDEHRRNLEDLQRWRDSRALTALAIEDESLATIGK